MVTEGGAAEWNVSEGGAAGCNVSEGGAAGCNATEGGAAGCKLSEGGAAGCTVTDGGAAGCTVTDGGALHVMLLKVVFPKVELKIMVLLFVIGMVVVSLQTVHSYTDWVAVRTDTDMWEEAVFLQ